MPDQLEGGFSCSTCTQSFSVVYLSPLQKSPQAYHVWPFTFDPFFQPDLGGRKHDPTILGCVASYEATNRADDDFNNLIFQVNVLWDLTVCFGERLYHCKLVAILEIPLLIHDTSLTGLNEHPTVY